MKKQMLLYIGLVSGCFAYSQQFTYKPINPAFGGDTFNYQWMLSSAASQNQFKGSVTGSGYGNLNALSSFTDSMNRQLLSQLSQKLFGDKFQDGLKPGTYMFGSLYLKVTNSDKGMIVTILDTSTGEQSEIIIPQ
jgi:curli production assembly/transport component CsgF